MFLLLKRRSYCSYVERHIAFNWVYAEEENDISNLTNKLRHKLLKLIWLMPKWNIEMISKVFKIELGTLYLYGLDKTCFYDIMLLLSSKKASISFHYRFIISITLFYYHIVRVSKQRLGTKLYEIHKFRKIILLA